MYFILEIGFFDYTIEIDVCEVNLCSKVLFFKFKEFDNGYIVEVFGVFTFQGEREFFVFLQFSLFRYMMILVERYF